MKKKILSILISIITLFTCAYTITACGGGSDNIFNARFFTFENNTITGLTESGKKQTILVIPSKINGESVTRIGTSAFSDCASLTTVIIPDSVTIIGSYAFHSCKNLTSVTIGENVTSIGEDAFRLCESLVEVCNKSNLSIIKGSTGNGYVGNSALNIYKPSSGESKLTTTSNGYIIYTDGTEKILVGYSGTSKKLIIPNSVTKIHKNAFCANKKITSVTIGDSVTTIGREAFMHCYSLISVTIGKNVTSIESSAFLQCYNLISVTFKNTNNWKVTSSYSGDTSISSSSLENQATAATYLIDTYKYYSWKRT